MDDHREQRDRALEESAGDGDGDALLKKHPALDRKLRSLFKGIGYDGESGKPPAADRMDEGRILGDFRILREIGSGGMATVYEAEQCSLNRRVALKVLHRHLSLSDRGVRKFRREAEAGGRQRHPGIVSIFMVGEDRGVHFIAQELVEGGRSLADRLEAHRRERDLPRGYFHQAAGWIADVARALAHAHASGVIHRDVKPSNILLTEEDRPKISDFGLARVVDALALSRSGEFMGTPYYMSPEQALTQRKKIDHRTDIFSLGVTLYECLTLARPFDGKTSHEVLKKVLFHEPRDPRRINPRIPRDLSVICLKAMEKAPGQRYQTMEAFAEDLDRFMTGEAVAARPAPRLRKTLNWFRRHKRPTVGAAVLLLAVVAVAVLLFMISGQRRAMLRTVEDRFAPMGDLLNWPEFPGTTTPWKWFMEADPDDPSGCMIKSLLVIKSGALKEAVSDLEACTVLCREAKETMLLKDTAYLMGLVKTRLAEESGDRPDIRNRLMEEADGAFRQAGTFDPFSEDVFLWREGPGAPPRASEGSRSFSDLKLNQEHFLIRLSLGLNLFNMLYKGGAKGSFDRAIGHFEAVLDARPDHLIAHVFLARVCYFFARFYHFLDFADRAEELLNRALSLSDGTPYPLIHTTLGQLALLRGREEEALDCFRRAFNGREGSDTTIHNAMSGMGTAFARMGDFEAAEKQYLASERQMRGDAHNLVAFSELHLLRNHLDQAVEYARMAKRRPMAYGVTKRSSFMASANLACMRAHLAKGEYDAALDNAVELYDIAEYSPRDMSLACMHLLELPDAYLHGKDGHTEPLALSVAVNLARYAGSDAQHRGRTSPIALSAMGVASYLKGEHPDAIRAFVRAVEERRNWSPSCAALRDMEDARDLFLLALVHASRGRTSAETEGSGAAQEMKEGMTAFQEAEKRFQKIPVSLRGSLLTKLQERSGKALKIQRGGQAEDG